MALSLLGIKKLIEEKMRYYKIIIISLTFSGYAHAFGSASTVCIENKSSLTYYINGAITKASDWQDKDASTSLNRPDLTWVREQVEPGEIICERTDWNIPWAGSPNPKFLLTASTQSDDSFMITPLNTSTFSRECKQQEARLGQIYCSIEAWKSSGGLIKGLASGFGSACVDKKMPYYSQCNLFQILR
ncbi:MAG: hypothetical protein EBS79_10120 [Gammaproteobacteria bacterium]|nr:hypothetical protein [Gammaproteobacteria bacterium]NBY21638.1 hypothetical protein [Gammaproteobacteria bacterium]